MNQHYSIVFEGTAFRHYPPLRLTAWSVNVHLANQTRHSTAASRRLRTILNLAMIILVALLTGCVTGAGGPGQTSPSPERSSPETFHSFPDRLLSIPKVSETDYETEHPGLGFSVGYSLPGITITVYVYDLGIHSIPAGIHSDEIINAFISAANDIIAAAQLGSYELLSIENGSEYSVSEMSYIWTSADLLMDGREMDSHLFVTGYGGEIVKVRVTLDRSSSPSNPFLESLMSEISGIIQTSNVR